MVVEIVGHALAAEDNYPIEKPIRPVSFAVLYDAYAQHFIFGWQLPIPNNFRSVFRVKHPQISELHISHPQKGLPYTRARLLSYCTLKWVHGYGL